MNENLSKKKWTFLTNHSHVLLCIHERPHIRMRDLALIVGITERAVQRIVTDLAEAGYVEVKKGGRCNIYITHEERKLHDPLESEGRVTDLIGLLNKQELKQREDGVLQHYHGYLDDTQGFPPHKEKNHED